MTDNTDTDGNDPGLRYMTKITVSVWVAILVVAYAPYVALTGFARYIGVVVAVPLAVLWGPFTFIYIRVLSNVLTTTFTDDHHQPGNKHR